MKELHRAGHRAVRGHLGMDLSDAGLVITDKGKGSFGCPQTALIRLGNDPYSPWHRDTALSPSCWSARKQCKAGRFEGPEHRPHAAAGRGRTARRPATAKSVLRQENVSHLFGIRGILEKQHHVMRSALPRIALLALIWDRVLVDHARRPRVLTGRGSLARLALGAAAPFAIVVARREAVPRSVWLWAHPGRGAVRQRGQCSYRRPCPRRKPGSCIGRL